MEKLETMLYEQNEHHRQCATPLSTTIIHAKTKSLRARMLLSQTRRCNPLLPVLGDLNVLRGHHVFHNLKLIGKAAAADSVAAEKSPHSPASS
jgi:hypothetical protein